MDWIAKAQNLSNSSMRKIACSIVSNIIMYTYVYIVRQQPLQTIATLKIRNLKNEFYQ